MVPRGKKPVQSFSDVIKPVEITTTLPVVPLAGVSSSLAEPHLVSGFELPFPLQSFNDLCGPEYPCPQDPVVVLYSPDGVFSSFAQSREVEQLGAGLRFADGHPYHPPHIYNLEDFPIAIEHMARAKTCDIEFVRGQQPLLYFRQPFPVKARDATLRQMRLDPHQFINFSTYCSDINSVTNFHFDDTAGCLQQCHGRKQVLLVHPRFSEYMRSEDNNKRSWLVNEARVVTVPHWNIILAPGDCLFIPRGFWHQVKSLDELTLGTTLTFRE